MTSFDDQNYEDSRSFIGTDPSDPNQFWFKLYSVEGYASERTKRSVAGWEDSSFQPDGEAPSGQAPLCGADTFRTLSMLHINSPTKREFWNRHE